MPVTIAFDVYGTLIDTHGVVLELQKLVGENALVFSQTWREKQLEYSFRRGLMQNYKDFSVCTSQALDYTCTYYKTSLSREQKQMLLFCYRTLPAFDDVVSGLSTLKDSGFNLYAFSNGSAEAVDTLLLSAQVRDCFVDVVSVEELKSFKPNPAVYSYFLRKSRSKGSDAWLISSNSFDVIGAISVGMRGAWVQRSQNAIFDPWGIEPTIAVENLNELKDQILNAN